jgi:hypothetical protein
MTKLNAGGLVAIAVLAAFVVGNSNAPKWLRLVVAALTLFAPVAVVFQNLGQSWVAILVFVIVAAVAATFVVMTIDTLALPIWSLAPAVAGVAGAGVVSLAFPLLTGTPISAVLTGVFVRPLDQSGQLIVPPLISVNWIAVLLTGAGVVAAVTFRSLSKEAAAARAPWAHAALAASGLWLIGLAATAAARSEATAEWLPALALLPALAYCARSPGFTRFALRSLVLVAALQILVAYPVAGSQVAWGTAAMTAPCAIAIALGIDYSRHWRESSSLTKLAVTAFVCLGLVVASTEWPVGIWNAYRQSPKLGLPGTGLMRIDPNLTAELQQVAQILDTQCDTFYGVPDENGFYVFTNEPPLNGMVADRPVGLDVGQQNQIVTALQTKLSDGERVCILRDLSQGNELAPGPLETALSQFTTIVGSAGSYTVSRHN